jgi:hypothetical protein
VSYFREWERFVTDFFASHSAWTRAVKSWKAGDLAQAREQLAQSKPEAVLQQYARTATHGRITSGEKALLVSMNLRWLSYIVSQRQALGMDAIRWKFEPTEDEPLAQQPGSYTFFLDREQHLWRGWGEKETGQPCFAKSDTPEDLDDAFLQVEKEFSLSLRCILDEPLLKGKYNAKLLFRALTPSTPETTVDIALHGSAGAEPVKNRIDLRQAPPDQSGLVTASYPVEIDQGFLRLDFKPVAGKAYLCGVVLEPTAA